MKYINQIIILSLVGITKVKTAKNIRCRRSLNYGQEASEKFQCELTVTPDGEVTADFNKLQTPRF